MVLENVGGSLVGISAHSQSAGTIIDIEPKITFRAYSGGTPRIIKEIKWTGTGTPTTLLKNLKAKKNDAVYFACKQYIENKTVNQVWMCGRNVIGQFFVTPDRLVNNDTALTGNVDGLDIIGDYMWTGYDGSGALKRTNDAASFTATSIYESAIFGSEDVGFEKKLIAVGVMTEPMPTAGQIVLKYRKNEETTFTTIFTHTTDNSLFHDAINIESSGATLPSYREITFRIESTGGAVPIGFKFKFELIPTNLSS